VAVDEWAGSRAVPYEKQIPVQASAGERRIWACADLGSWQGKGKKALSEGDTQIRPVLEAGSASKEKRRRGRAAANEMCQVARAAASTRGAQAIYA